MKLTRRALLLAVAATISAAVTWPEGAERVARGAFVAVGAALVTDLVITLRRALPTEQAQPFAPPRSRPRPPWRPRGLVELQREIRLMTVAGGGARLPRSHRLRETCRAAARARLRTLGLDLDRPEDGAAARAVLGPASYDFIVGDAPVAPVDELLAAVGADPAVSGERAGP